MTPVDNHKKQLMSLVLTLVSMNDLPEGVSIYVEGSQAGPLITKSGHSPINKFNVACNAKNVLLIKVFNGSDGSLIGETHFSSARFLRENKYNPKIYNTEQVLYETHIFNQAEMPCGRLGFSLKYYPGTLYLGQKMGIFESKPERQPVAMFKGAVESKNMFSWMDPGYKEAPFSAVQSTYRDETWGKRK